MKHVILSAAVSLAALLILGGCKCCKKSHKAECAAAMPVFVPVLVCPCCGAMNCQRPVMPQQHPCPLLKHLASCPAKCPMLTAPPPQAGVCKAAPCGKAPAGHACPMMKKPCPATQSQTPEPGNGGPWISGVIVESETVETLPGNGGQSTPPAAAPAVKTPPVKTPAPAAK